VETLKPADQPPPEEPEQPVEEIVDEEAVPMTNDQRLEILDVAKGLGWNRAKLHSLSKELYGHDASTLTTDEADGMLKAMKNE
jgi:hypothetical protein